jgi:hypothetical protein
MKKYLLILVGFASFLLNASAQNVLLAQDVAKDSIPEKFGPNLKHYTHFYLGYGFVVGPSENKGSQVKYPASHEWVIGLRYKYKVGEVYALGLDLTLTPQVFHLKQKEGKTLPTTTLYEYEKLKFNNLGLTFYNRFNWDKRGNYMGNFVDLGVYGNWLASAAHVYADEEIFGVGGPLSGVKNVKVRESGLEYVADFNYGALVRVGFNRYVFYGTYRISDLFDSGHSVFDPETGKNLWGFPELPRFTIGFQLSLHK